MNQKLKFILALSTLLLMCAFCIFIWPTPYQYSTVKIGRWEFTKRTFRLTGKSQIRTIKALVPELQKWQYDNYGASIKIPEVEAFAQELRMGKHPKIFPPDSSILRIERDSMNPDSGINARHLLAVAKYDVEAQNIALSYLYESEQEWIWLDWY